MSMTATEQAKKQCPYWIMSMQQDWKAAFCHAANGSEHYSPPREDDFSPWAEGWRAGKKWRQEQESNNE